MLSSIPAVSGLIMLSTLGWTAQWHNSQAGARLLVAQKREGNLHNSITAPTMLMAGNTFAQAVVHWAEAPCEGQLGRPRQGGCSSK